MPDVVDVPFKSDDCSKFIVNTWTTWNAARTEWLKERSELRGFLFATSTRSTTNKQLPWKNSTVTPKLTQIRDNLHANYMAALFPSENWFEWRGDDMQSTSIEKRRAITSYMKAKLKQSHFENVVSQLVLDYIDYGNVFVGHEYVHETQVDEATGEELTHFRGPRAYRISPLDIVMNPLATTFDASAVVVRKMLTLGDIVRNIETKPTVYKQGVLKNMQDWRKFIHDHPDAIKNEGLGVDGFGSYHQYVASGLVEVLEFWGDYYEVSENKLYTSMHIMVVDRMFVLLEEKNPSWLGKKPIAHCGWRIRPDNLWAQGPLDQLIGLQYRIDHLENLKADVFDQIAHPVVKIKGNTVDDFVFAPGNKIYVGDEGDVTFERPDAQALTADMQISDLMNKMEELAGAPKQAMGIRTPGEKTKYEVQVLENGAGRIFQSKVNWFEKTLIEPLINSMLEEARRVMGAAETIKVTDDEGIDTFPDITKMDIIGTGKLYPMGARHHAEKARFVQELTQTIQTAGSLDIVKPHISGWGVAQALNEALGWTNYNIVRKNVALDEQQETATLMQAAEERVAATGAAPSELQPEDYVVPGGEDEGNPTQEQAI